MPKRQTTQPTPPPEQYKPLAVVQGDKLPVRYKKSQRTDKLIAQAARRATLEAVYFGEDS